MSTCSRRTVGAVAVSDVGVLSVGWNYMTAPECPREREEVKHLVRTLETPYDAGTVGACVAVHAEIMALRACWPQRPKMLYVTCQPCYQCLEVLELLAVEFTIIQLR